VPTYATATDLRTYTGLSSTDLPDNEANVLLVKAERDLDGLVVVNTVERTSENTFATTGRKFDPTTLADWQQVVLRDATCAQAEYRREMGDAFFIRGQHHEVTGPDYTTKGRLPRIAPGVWVAVGGTGLIKRTTTTYQRVAPPDPLSTTEPEDY